MPPTPPPARTIEEARRKHSTSYVLIRMGLSFALGIIGFLALLVVTGNKSFTEVFEMVRELFI